MVGNDYYRLARRLKSLDLQSLSNELRAFHQATVDAAAERAADIVREGRESGDSTEAIEASVRSIELDGRQVADDRLHVRYAEAVLYVLRERKALIVPRNDIREAFDGGHGVEIVRDNPTMIEVERKPGKFAGE